MQYGSLLSREMDTSQLWKASDSLLCIGLTWLFVLMKRELNTGGTWLFYSIQLKDFFC